MQHEESILPATWITAPQVAHVYSVEYNRLCSYQIVDYTPSTGAVMAVDASIQPHRRFRVTLECSDTFFATPEEAIRQGYKELQEMVVGAREEYQDALASYRVARKLGRMSKQEYREKVLG